MTEIRSGVRITTQADDTASREVKSLNDALTDLDEQAQRQSFPDDQANGFAETLNRLGDGLINLIEELAGTDDGTQQLDSTFQDAESSTLSYAQSLSEAERQSASLAIQQQELDQSTQQTNLAWVGVATTLVSVGGAAILLARRFAVLNTVSESFRTVTESMQEALERRTRAQEQASSAVVNSTQAADDYVEGLKNQQRQADANARGQDALNMVLRRAREENVTLRDSTRDLGRNLHEGAQEADLYNRGARRAAEGISILGNRIGAGVLALRAFNLVALASGAAIGAIVTAIALGVRSVGQFAQELNFLSDQTGRAVQDLNALSTALAQYGVNQDQTNDLLITFAERLGEARLDPSTEFASFFDTLELDVNSASTTLEEFIRRVNDLQDASLEQYIIQTVLSGEGARVAAALANDDFESRLEIAANLALPQRDLDRFAEAASSLQRLGSATNAAFQRALIPFTGTVERAAVVLAVALENSVEFIDNLREFDRETDQELLNGINRWDAAIREFLSVIPPFLGRLSVDAPEFIPTEGPFPPPATEIGFSGDQADQLEEMGKAVSLSICTERSIALATSERRSSSSATIRAAECSIR